jgi:hypothetical protein
MLGIIIDKARTNDNLGYFKNGMSKARHKAIQCRVPKYTHLVGNIKYVLMLISNAKLAI